MVPLAACLMLRGVYVAVVATSGHGQDRREQDRMLQRAAILVSMGLATLFASSGWLGLPSSPPWALLQASVCGLAAGFAVQVALHRRDADLAARTAASLPRRRGVGGRGAGARPPRPAVPVDAPEPGTPIDPLRAVRPPGLRPATRPVDDGDPLRPSGQAPGATRPVGPRPPASARPSGPGVKVAGGS